jgi:ElaB/YqjD/DUF883 family membrane-anchored ribosome-binding protein
MADEPRTEFGGVALPHALQQQGEKLREQLESFDERVRAFVHERPIAAVAVAALCGFVIARIASRW